MKKIGETLDGHVRESKQVIKDDSVVIRELLLVCRLQRSLFKEFMV